MSTPGAAVDLMVKDCFKASVSLRLNAMPTILSTEELVKAISQVATSLNTRMWGGFHSCLALVLEETEMSHVANDRALNGNRTEKPPFTHPDVTPLTTVTKNKQLTNEHKVAWDEHHLQESIILHGRAAIFASVMPQYIK